MKEYKLTEYSHGSGCGCKIAPEVLDNILQGVKTGSDFPDLLIGNNHKDDAAVISVDEKKAIISTTDFFMPIVDDPFDFGRIAATNALSDIYAMGGKPLMAVSIFGWPIDKLPEEIGRRVIEGGQYTCEEAGIPLAGGHSIDSPEPIFGLAVTGIIDKDKIKSNSNAQKGDLLYLTKPLGIGILTTAEKRKILKDADRGVAAALMLKLNDIGALLAQIEEVHAITDVTGFGLIGHLSEICLASGVSAEVEFGKLPLISGLKYYLDQDCVPGGTEKNFKSYKHLISEINLFQKQVLFDPQTSGGLLITVDPSKQNEIENLLEESMLTSICIGKVVSSHLPLINVI